MNKKRKKYMKPSFEVFELKRQPVFLAGSGGLNTPASYPLTDDPLVFS